MDEKIEKINLDENSGKNYRTHVVEKNIDEGSVLIPKINPDGNAKYTEMKEEKTKKVKDIKLPKRRILKIAGVSAIIVTFISILLALLFYRTYQSAQEVIAAGNKLQAAVQEQNLPKIKEELADTDTEVKKLRANYSKISWLSFFPYFGKFIGDGKHGLAAASYGIEAAEILVDVAEPYADIIGFVPGSGNEPGSGQETAQDRIDFIIKTIPDILPRSDELIEKVALMQKEIDHIDPNDYPKEFAGRVVKERLRVGRDLVDTASEFIVNSKPLLEKAQYILGAEDGPRTYMVIFQNDKELRPTGGFITAYSVAKVEAGKFDPEISDDIYKLDDNYTPAVSAPQPLIDYIKGPYIISPKYRLRDMNWSPDFSVSMDLFAQEVKKAGITDIDGIIAVDTQALVNILDAIGTVDVPGYGGYSTDIVPLCNCAQVVYELESFADVEGPIVWSENEPGKIVFAPENYDDRKAIIGPLMNSILANALGQSKENLPKLFEAVFKSVVEKHVLFYMFDADAQNAVEVFGTAGILDEFEGDYFHLNDANLAGRKSNLYVTQEINQEITITRDGTVEKKVTITYQNPQKYDGWLNSVLPNWVRLYVPKGSELISVEGLEKQEEAYEDLGKTVFAGFFQLRPEGLAVISFNYRLPQKAVDGEYSLFLQKQPGKDAPLYTVSVNGHSEEFFLKTDKKLTFKL
jgi:hypothetical protein